MRAVRQSSGITHRHLYRKPKHTRSLSPVYLPADLWLLLPPHLIPADIRALAGVCVTLRVMFRPLMEFKVTITRNDSPKYALRKALVVTRTSTILDSVVEVNIGWGLYYFNNPLWSCKFPCLLSPALYTLVNAIPAMQHLHTIQLNSILLSRIYLYTILSSPHLIHLILHNVPLPKMSTFPPPTLRKLTLRMMEYPWESVQPLISQLAMSLEYLDVYWCIFRPPSQIQLPSFPCLQELRHHQYYHQSTFSDRNQLNELLRLAPQVTHLRVTGNSNEPVSACRKSLQHLSTSFWVLSDDIFGTEPFLRLMHLSLELTRPTDVVNHPLTPSSFIRNHFPAITSLHLTIPWTFRNCAMAMAQSLQNVQALKLVVEMHYKESGEMGYRFPVEVLDDQLHQPKLPAALQALTLEAVQHCGELERGATLCIQWVLDHVIPPVTGLGGTGLKSISVVVSQPQSRPVERERVLLRRWVRAPNDDWQVLE